jgi:group I intron endonuclease
VTIQDLAQGPVTGRVGTGDSLKVTLNISVMAIIYKITNQLNSKCYIGWTSQPLEKRWDQHKKTAQKNQDNRPFYNAIRKYGIDVWNLETLEILPTKEIAKQQEVHYIKLFESYDTGYNATLGGDGNNGIKMSPESNIARSNALKGIPKDYDRMAGKSHSEESRKAISESHKGMKKPWVKWTKEQCAARGMTRRALTKTQYDQIHKLKHIGYSIKIIAEQIGAKPDVVKKWLKKTWL